MTQVTIDEAQHQLPGLLAAADAGESVLIVTGDGKAFRLVPTPPRPPITGTPKAGRWKGRLVVPDAFDESLEELRDYMP